MEKLCKRCNRVLPIELFGSDVHTYDNHACYCRDCINARARWYNELKRSGRVVKLANCTTEELLKELSYRLLNE